MTDCLLAAIMGRWSGDIVTCNDAIELAQELTMVVGGVIMMVGLFEDWIMSTIGNLIKIFANDADLDSGKVETIARLINEIKEYKIILSEHFDVMMDYVAACSNLDDMIFLLDSIVSAQHFYHLHFWHGFDEKVLEELRRAGEILKFTVDGKQLYLYIGSIDELMEEYTRPIMLLPMDKYKVESSENRQTFPGCRTLCVTVYNNFNQR